MLFKSITCAFNTTLSAIYGNFQRTTNWIRWRNERNCKRYILDCFK